LEASGLEHRPKVSAKEALADRAKHWLNQLINAPPSSAIPLRLLVVDHASISFSASPMFSTKAPTVTAQYSVFLSMVGINGGFAPRSRRDTAQEAIENGYQQRDRPCSVTGSSRRLCALRPGRVPQGPCAIEKGMRPH